MNCKLPLDAVASSPCAMRAVGSQIMWSGRAGQQRALTSTHARCALMISGMHGGVMGDGANVNGVGLGVSRCRSTAALHACCVFHGTSMCCSSIAMCMCAAADVGGMRASVSSGQDATERHVSEAGVSSGAESIVPACGQWPQCTFRTTTSQASRVCIGRHRQESPGRACRRCIM